MIYVLPRKILYLHFRDRGSILIHDMGSSKKEVVLVIPNSTCRIIIDRNDMWGDTIHIYYLCVEQAVYNK